MAGAFVTGGVVSPAVVGATAAELDATTDDAACGDDTAVEGDAIVLPAPSDVRGRDDPAT